jgi:hypothetical protein
MTAHPTLAPTTAEACALKASVLGAAYRAVAVGAVTGLGIGAHDDVETYVDYYIAGQRLVCLIRETALLHFPPGLQLLPVPDAWGPAIVAHS